MSAATETIRRMLAHFENASRTHSEKAGATDALAALGRVEERERVLTEALRPFADAVVEDGAFLNCPAVEGIETDDWLRARAALAGSVAGEEQEDPQAPRLLRRDGQDSGDGGRATQDPEIGASSASASAAAGSGEE